MPAPATAERLIPCTHLIETDQPTCHLGHALPHNCAACANRRSGRDRQGPGYAPRTSVQRELQALMDGKIKQLGKHDPTMAAALKEEIKTRTRTRLRTQVQDTLKPNHPKARVNARELVEDYLSGRKKKKLPLFATA